MLRNLLILCLFFPLTLYAYIIKDPKLGSISTAGSIEDKGVSFSYNPYSIYVPSKSFLKKLSVDKIMDMGASAYVIGHYSKALYFYMSITELFPNDIKTLSWAYYEIAYIYYKKQKHELAIQYFSEIQNIKGAPITVQNLSKSMALRVVNRKEYAVLRKQEDFVFHSERKFRRQVERQIAKEEREAEALQRKMSRERKRMDREENRKIAQQKKSKE